MKGKNPHLPYPTPLVPYRWATPSMFEKIYLGVDHDGDQV